MEAGIFAGELVPVLRQLSQAKGWKTQNQDETPDAPLLKIELPQSDLISFEPGGQIEFSSVPYPCLEQACERMRHVFVELDEGLEQHGLKRVELGINPFASVDEIGLQMTKPRYRAMDKHFSSYWPEGRRMMRQTCTLQVNLDFGPDEATLWRRYLVSQLMAPFATAIFANSLSSRGGSPGTSLSAVFAGVRWILAGQVLSICQL